MLWDAHLAGASLWNLNYGLRVFESCSLLEAARSGWLFGFRARHVLWRHDHSGSASWIHLTEQATRLSRVLNLSCRRRLVRFLLFCQSLLPHQLSFRFLFLFILWIRLGSCLSIYRHSTQICLRPKETCFFVLVVCVYLDHTPEIILHILLERLLKCVFAQQHFVAFGSLFRL